MADYQEEEKSTRQLITSLCRAILNQSVQTKEKARLNNPLKLSQISRSSLEENEIIKKLFNITYDLIILRTNEWTNRRKSPLSSDLRCLSHVFYLSKDKERSLLTESVISLTHYEYSESIFDFLSNLSNLPQKVTPSLTHQATRGYTIYPNSLFESIPVASSSLSYSNNEIFHSDPSTTCSFYTQEDISISSCDTTLFSGLTHTTTSSIDSTLRVPPLSDTPPDLLERHLQGYASYNLTPPTTPPPDDSPQSDSVIVEVINSITSFNEPRPPVSWEGPLKSDRYYLSESGPESFHYSIDKFVSLLADVGRVERLPWQYPRELENIKQFREQLEKCFEWADKRKADVELFGDDIVKSFHQSIYSLLLYCQVKLDLMSAKDSSQFWLDASLSSHNLELILNLVVSVLNTSWTCMEGLELLDKLYTHCINYQGLPLYPLLIGLFRQTALPYLRFLQKWVFQGEYFEGFGLLLNQSSLQTRDCRYWTSGYCFKNDSVPLFVAGYKEVILTAGKSLNLLRLCCPDHHLCKEVYSSSLLPTLALAHSLDQVKQVYEQSHTYKKRMDTLAVQYEKERQIEILERELAVLKPILEARRKAREALKEIQEEEEERQKREFEEKKILLNTLKEEADRARALKRELEEEEKEKDRHDLEPDPKKQQLEEEVRQELIKHYEGLGEQAELRRVRAEWRTKRFALRQERIQLMKDIEERERYMLLDKEYYDIEDERDQEDELPIVIHVDDQLLHSLNETSSDEIPSTSRPDHTPQVTVQDLLYHSDEVTPISHVTTRGHTPQSVVQDILYHSDKAPPTDHVAARGHTPQSVVQDILYRSDKAPLTEYVTTWGHTPQSIVQDVLCPSDKATPIDHVTTRGHTPQSVIQDIIYPDIPPPADHTSDQNNTVIPPAPPTTSRGHAPSSSIQKLLYYGRNDKKEEKENEQIFTINYPSVTPYSRYTTTHPFTELPYRHTKSNHYTGSPDFSMIDKTHLILPLPALVKECLSCPLSIQVHLVNTALVQYFMCQLSLMNHFLFLKRCLLLEDSGFSDTLCSGLFHQLIYGHTLEQISTISFLSPLLHSALDRSLHKHSPINDSQLREQLSLKSNYKPSHLSTTSLKVLDFLHMDYEVDWPLNIVITKDSLNKYNKVFQFILQIKRASWMLKRVFKSLSRNGLEERLSPQQIRLIHAQRQELQHFVTVMEGYLTNQLYHLSWNEFQYNLSKVKCFDGLIECFNSYVDSMLSRCLLNKKAAPVLTLISNSLSSIVKFSSLLLNFETMPSSLCPSLSSIYHSFSESCHLLFKVIEKLVERGYQPFLEELLLRLNFNHHYK